MKHKVLLLTCIFFSTLTFAQTTVLIDFDNDGIMDKANLITTNNGYRDGSYRIEFTVSSHGGQTQSTQLITFTGMEVNLTVAKNVLVIHPQFMREENIFKFRYDSKLKKIILIGYENTQYGNLSHNGSGGSSFNLITGAYEATWSCFDEKKEDLIEFPKISKKLPIKIYTLNQFSDKTIDIMYEIDYKLTPEKCK